MRARALWVLVGASLAPLLARAGCTINVVSVAFGDYDVFRQQDAETTGAVSVTCAPSASYTISLSAGFGTFASRVMTNGSYQLEYNLFTDPQRLTVWGDGSSGTATVSDTGTGGSYTVYALVPALQNVTAGSYSDTITVTVTY